MWWHIVRNAHRIALSQETMKYYQLHLAGIGWIVEVYVHSISCHNKWALLRIGSAKVGISWFSLEYSGTTDTHMVGRIKLKHRMASIQCNRKWKIEFETHSLWRYFRCTQLHSTDYESNENEIDSVSMFLSKCSKIQIQNNWNATNVAVVRSIRNRMWVKRTENNCTFGNEWINKIEMAGELKKKEEEQSGNSTESLNAYWCHHY